MSHGQAADRIRRSSVASSSGSQKRLVRSQETLLKAVMKVQDAREGAAAEVAKSTGREEVDAESQDAGSEGNPAVPEHAWGVTADIVDPFKSP